MKAPEQMTERERFTEIAGILAAGFLRLRRRRGYIPGECPPPVKAEKSSRN